MHLLPTNLLAFSEVVLFLVRLPNIVEILSLQVLSVGLLHDLDLGLLFQEQLFIPELLFHLQLHEGQTRVQNLSRAVASHVGQKEPLGVPQRTLVYPCLHLGCKLRAVHHLLFLDILVQERLDLQVVHLRHTFCTLLVVRLRILLRIVLIRIPSF